MLQTRLNKQEAESIFNSWDDLKPIPINDGANEYLRKDLLEIFENVLKFLELSDDELNKKSYQVDLEFGLKLYEKLNSYSDFTIRLAADNDFWRYLSIRVIPDIVYLRWGLKESRFWREPRRLWLKTIWWYIHLSWQGSIEETREILKGNSTDEIVQLVERAGPNGYRVNLTREIMKEYGSYGRNQKSRNQSLFRKVMKLNTAKVQTIEPGLHIEGESSYVKELFRYFE